MLLPLQELEAEIQSTCRDLSIPLPVPVSVLLGSLGHAPNQATEAAAAAAAAAAGVPVQAAPVMRGAAAEASCNVFVQLMLAAIHPDGHIPDTPERKVGFWIQIAKLACKWFVLQCCADGDHTTCMHRRCFCMMLQLIRLIAELYVNNAGHRNTYCINREGSRHHSFPARECNIHHTEVGSVCICVSCRRGGKPSGV